MTTTTDAASLFDFIPGLAVDELHQELDVANTATTLGRRKLALCLADMDERGVFAMTGHSSAVHYAMTRLKVARRCAQDYVKIGRQLGDLPRVDAAVVAGDIGWSKLRIIMRVAAPDTQVEWLARADEMSCEELSIDVARHQPGESPKSRNPAGLQELFMTVRARLRLVNHEMWEQAKKKLAAEMRMRVTNEDLMIHAARLILSTDVEGKTEGRSRVKHSPFQLIVHQDADGTRVHTSHGEVEVREDQAARICAQAEVVPAAEPVTDPDAETPPRMVRRVLARDDQCCQNCRRTLHLHVHHVVFRSHGGKTEEDNLVAVCSLCHTLIHQGLLQLRGEREGSFVFLDRSGGEVARGSIPQTAAVRDLVPRSKREHIMRSLYFVRTRRELAPAWSQELHF